MTRVFRSRAEAEAEGYIMSGRFIDGTLRARKRGTIDGDFSIVRTDLEAQLAEVIEAVEWSGWNDGRSCPICLASADYGAPHKHRDDCTLSLALKAFKGETK